jgi:hypothetical protein
MDNSYIEIVNFDSMLIDEPNIESFDFHQEDIKQNCLNTYLTEKHGDRQEQTDSINFFQSNSFTNIMNNDSFDSYFSNDNDILSCFSENINLQTPSIFESDRSLISLDNCTPGSSSKKRSKEFTCPDPQCTKVYKSKENLTLHYRNIHLKEKPYSCKFCSAVFSHRNGKYRLT